MSPALSPELALDYLHELSTDIRAAIVLDHDGNRLAGPDDLLAPARALLAAAPDAAAIEVLRRDARVFAARGRTCAVLVVCGRLALPALVLCDLRAVLADLDGERPVIPPSTREAA